MKIAVGSKNVAKVNAVRDILVEYPNLAGATVEAVEAPSEVPSQPMSLEETMRGAMNRAKNAFRDCDYSIGIESVIFQVPLSKTGYMDICVAAIHDGKDFHFGTPSAWEFPKKEILDFILRDGLDMSAAINRAGLTADPNIGAGEGAIGILTKGRVNRKAYTQQALRMALIHLEN